MLEGKTVEVTDEVKIIRSFLPARWDSIGYEETNSHELARLCATESLRRMIDVLTRDRHCL